MDNILVISEEGELFLSNLYRAAAELRNQDSVTGLDANLYSLSVAVETTRSNSEDTALRELLDGGFGEEDSGGGLGLCSDSLDEDAVQERSKGLYGADRGGSL